MHKGDAMNMIHAHARLQAMSIHDAYALPSATCADILQ